MTQNPTLETEENLILLAEAPFLVCEMKGDEQYGLLILPQEAWMQARRYRRALATARKRYGDEVRSIDVRSDASYLYDFSHGVEAVDIGEDGLFDESLFRAKGLVRAKSVPVWDHEHEDDRILYEKGSLYGTGDVDVGCNPPELVILTNGVQWSDELLYSDLFTWKDLAKLARLFK